MTPQLEQLTEAARAAYLRAPGDLQEAMLAAVLAILNELREPSWQMEKAFHDASPFAYDLSFETRWRAALDSLTQHEGGGVKRNQVVREPSSDASDRDCPAVGEVR